MKRIGAIVRDMREAQGMTQSALADAVNVSVRTIIDIEKDRRNPTFDTLYMLVRTLNISSDSVFGIESNRVSLIKNMLINEIQSLDDAEATIVYKTVHAMITALHEQAQ